MKSFDEITKPTQLKGKTLPKETNRNKIVSQGKSVVYAFLLEELTRILKKKWSERTIVDKFVVTVSREDHAAFHAIDVWLSQFSPDKNVTSVSAFSYGSSSLGLRLPKTSAAITHNGLPIEIKYQQDGATPGLAPSVDLIVEVQKRDALTEVIVDEIPRWYEQYRRAEDKTKLRVYTPGTWEWDVSYRPLRRLADIVSATDAVERLYTNVLDFLKQEERYGSLGVPWHRGYVLHGSPGTGKTSTVMALGSELAMPVHTLNLATLATDGSLSRLISHISPRSILLLDDIDVHTGAVGRTKDGGVTLAGLLELLDGPTTPHGLVTFMTTNHLEALDAALIRPGRVDMQIEFENHGSNEVLRMFNKVHPRSNPPKLPSGVQWSPAAVAACLRASLDDPERAKKDLENLPGVC